MKRCGGEIMKGSCKEWIGSGEVDGGRGEKVEGDEGI